MEKLLVKGEKVVISRINDPSQQMEFELKYSRDVNVLYDIDFFVIMMDERKKTLKDNIVFYGNPFSEVGDIHFEEVYEVTQVKKTVKLTLSKIPSSIQSICFACPIYCKDKKKEEDPVFKSLRMDAKNRTIRSYMFSSLDKLNILKDQVLILGEIYKYKDTWKYNAVKQNMEEEMMTALKKLYGLEVY